jgi:hypothetical protein
MTKQKEEFNVNTEADFQRLMESVDEEMRQGEVPVTARALKGWLEISFRFGLRLQFPAPQREPREGCYTGYDLTIRIFRWFDNRYGERQGIDPTWKMAVLIRGDAYRLTIPLVFGQANVICSVKQFGTTESNKVATGNVLPVLNVLDLIEGLTEGYAKSLKHGMSAMMSVEAVIRSALVKEAVGDIEASVSNVFSNPPQYGLSKWASLQAAEKLIKAYIAHKGKTFKQTHILNDLADAAEAEGLRPIPRATLDKIQCSPGVRYGAPAVSLVEAVEAHQAALDVCAGVAEQIAP